MTDQPTAPATPADPAPPPPDAGSPPPAAAAPAAGRTASADAQRARSALLAVRAEVAKAVVGQDAAVAGLLVALLCRGHVLLEGVPGVAKTLLVRSLAAAARHRDQAGAVHPRPDAGRHHRLAGLRRALERRSPSGEGRSSPTCCWPTRSTARRRRRRRRCSRRWRSGRSRVDGHAAPAARRRSWSSPRRTRWSTRAPTRCPRPSSTGSCSRSVLPLPQRDEEVAGARAGTRAASTRATWPRPASGPSPPRPTSPPARGAVRERGDLRRGRRPTSSTSPGRPGARRRCSSGVSPRGATALLATRRAWAWLSGRGFVTPDDVKALAHADAAATGCRCARRPSSRASASTAVLDSVLGAVPVPR